jgi:hypothetical protein
LRVVITTNEEERLCRIHSKDRKYQYMSVSNAKQNNKEYFVELQAILERPGVQRAMYEYVLTLDYQEFDFINDRVPCDAYDNSKMLGFKREVTFLAHLVKLRPEKCTGTQATATLYEEFSDYLATAYKGRMQEWTSSVVSFGMQLAKIPGFEKNKSHGNFNSWHIDIAKLLHHLTGLELLSPLEAEWARKQAKGGVHGPNYGIEHYVAERSKK